MNLELRAIKLAKNLSEETPAYTATLYVDGKKAATLSNNGTGGGDRVWWEKGDFEARVDAYFKALPPIAYHGMLLEQELEMWAHGEVWAQDEIKSLGRALKKKVHVSVDKKIQVFNIGPDHLEQFRAQIVAKYPTGVILNDLSAPDFANFVRAQGN